MAVIPKQSVPYVPVCNIPSGLAGTLPHSSPVVQLHILQFEWEQMTQIKKETNFNVSFKWILSIIAY